MPQLSLDRFNATSVNALLQQMTEDARAVVEPALGKAKATVQVIADCRYVGQGHEIRVPVPVKTLKDSDGAKLKAAFEAQYEQVYGLRIPNQEAEAITWSVTVSSQTRKPKKAARAAGKSTPKPRSRRLIYDPALGKQVMAPVYWRFDMKPGAALKRSGDHRRGRDLDHRGRQLQGKDQQLGLYRSGARKMSPNPITLMLKCEPRECGASLEALATDAIGKSPSRSGSAGHLMVRGKQT